MSETNNSSTKTILPIVVGAASLINILMSFPDWQKLSNLLSVIGILSSILFLFKNQKSSDLLYIWILGQLIIVEPYFDLSQVYSVKFGLTFNDTASVNVNLIAIVLFGALKFLQVSQLIGKKISFKKFRDDSSINQYLPLEGTIINSVILSGENDWLLIKLNNSIDYNSSRIEYVVIKPKSGSIFKIKKESVIIYFGLAIDVDDLVNDKAEKSKFIFIDWVRCQMA